MRNLLLGAGNSRTKKVSITGTEWQGELVTLDMNPGCGADVIWDLEKRPLPFGDEEFDEMGAFDVLEHIGRLGDWKGYFDEFAEYWRILKPGGLFNILVPINKEALADPGHTRFFHINHFAFLAQEFYSYNLERGMPVTDYRWYWKRNFEMAEHQETDGHHLAVIFRKA